MNMEITKQYLPEVASYRDLILKEIDGIYLRAQAELSNKTFIPPPEMVIAVQRAAIHAAQPWNAELIRLEQFAQIRWIAPMPKT